MTAILGFAIWLYNVLAGIQSFAVTLLSNLSVGGQVSAGAVVTSFLQASQIYNGLNAVAGPLTTGTYAVPVQVQHVYASSGASIAGGVIWQLQAGAIANAHCRLVNNSNSAAITVKDQAGATIAAIRASSGGYYAATCCFVSGSWIVIEQNLMP